MSIDREQLREQYLKNKITRIDSEVRGREVLSNENMLELPRHQVNCPEFQECPIDYKCRAYNSKYMKCIKCPLNNTDGICHKKSLHTEKIFNMMIKRPRIDLDDKNKVLANQRS